MLWAAWFCACTPLVSHLFLTVGALGHMILHLSSPSLPHLSLGCPPFDSHCLEVRCGCSGPHESTPVSSAVGALSNLHPSCLPLPGSALDQLSPSWLLGSPLSKKGVDAFDLLILDLSPTCLSQVCCRCSGPNHAAGALGPLILHLPPTSLPVCCGCSELHGSTLVPHLSRACLRLSCCMLWVHWAAWFYTCFPLVSRLSSTVSQHAVGALGNRLDSTLGDGPTKIKHYKAQFIYIYNSKINK